MTSDLFANSTTSNFTTIALSWYDYFIFSIVLGCSALIGIYFGCFGTKQATPDEYLFGGKKMKIVPIAISVSLSQISGITLIGVASDVYIYGASFWWICLSLVLVCFLMIYIYMPVFFNLRLTSNFSYLEKRFDRKNRLLASVFYIFFTNFYIALVVYNAATTFSAATGTNFYVVCVILCSTCIFYTTIGGLKTVVWTDVVQCAVIVISLSSVSIISFNSLGFLNIWNRAVEGGRLDILDFDLNPTKRDSFWIMIIGYTIQAFALVGVHPTGVQKFIALPTFADAVKSIICFALCTGILITMCIFIGLEAYAQYANCDPLVNKRIKHYNHLVPYYIIDVAKNVPGIFGLFIAAIFSGALSSISSSLNALAGIVYKDFVSHRLKNPISEKFETMILKLIVAISGIICSLSVFLVQYLEGGIYAMTVAATALINGPLTGMFTLGLLFPKANSKGAFYGAIGGVISVLAITVPAQYYQSQQLLKYPIKKLSSNKCDVLSSASALNETIIESVTRSVLHTTEELQSNETALSKPFFLFRISFYYYPFIGALATVVLGLIISFLTNRNRTYVEKILISPLSQFLLPKNNLNEPIHQEHQL